jgi:hypothetical protein
MAAALCDTCGNEIDDEAGCTMSWRVLDGVPSYRIRMSTETFGL